MKHALLTALGTIAFLATLHADTDSEVNEQFDEIVRQATNEVSENLAKYALANERPLTRARSDLASLIKRLNEEKRTALATTLQKRLNGLEETVQRHASAKVPIVEPPKKSLLERLEGKWDITNEPRHYRLYTNGTAECVQDRDNQVLSTGRITVISPHVAEVVWGSGWKDQFRISGDDVAVSVFAWNPAGQRNGVGFALERVR